MWSYINICVISGNCWQYKDYAAERLKTLSVSVVNLLQSADGRGVGWENGVSASTRKAFLPWSPITFLKSVLRRQEVFLSFSFKSVLLQDNYTDCSCVLESGFVKRTRCPSGCNLLIPFAVIQEGIPLIQSLGHGLVNFAETKSKCRHLKKLTCKGT